MEILKREINILPYLTSKMAENKNIIDLSSEMLYFYDDNDVSQYYWPENSHFNGRGYAVLGDLVYQQLEIKIKDKIYNCHNSIQLNSEGYHNFGAAFYNKCLP